MADARTDFHCMVQVFQHHTRRAFDIISFIETMRNLRVINKKQYHDLHRTFNNLGYTNILELLRHLLPLLKYEQICFLFEEEGYRDISSDLRCKRFTLLYKRPPQIEMPHSKLTQIYYQRLKSCIDNNTFSERPKQRIRQFISEQDDKIITVGVPLHEREFAIEKKAAATVLLIQQYKDVDERKTILKQLISTETNGINNRSLEIVFHSKMAITEADAGNVEKANEHILKTKEFCCMYKPCFAVTSAFHDIEYAYKSIYFRNPSEELLDKIIFEGDIAIQSLNDESEDVQHLWKRIMLLFIVLSLLFITPDFVVRDIRKIKEIHRKRAENILKEIKGLSQDMQFRRQMILYLCLAVLNEEKDIKAAEKYAKHAVNAADKGGCFREVEKQNVKAYLDKICRKIVLRNIFKVLKNVVILMLIVIFGIGLYLFIEHEQILDSSLDSNVNTLISITATSISPTAFVLVIVIQLIMVIILRSFF